MKTTLYEITDELSKILESIEDSEGEATDYTLAELEQLNISLFEKINNISKFVKNLSAKVKMYKDAEQELKKKRQATENKIEWLKAYIMENMKKAEINKVEGDLFTTKIQNSPPSVNILNEEEIPKDYIEIVTQKKINKKAILTLLKSGEEVAGAEIIQNKHLRIS